MRENRPYGSEGAASQTNGTSLPLSLGKPPAALTRRTSSTIGDTVKGTPWSLENALRVRSNHPNRWF